MLFSAGMPNIFLTSSLALSILGSGACQQLGTSEQFAIVSGAIFTTTADGSRVNGNIYEAKEDVYLDGGPGMNAPPGAAGLPQGDYYFQVTSPSGQDLLSSDDISCRRFRVNAAGVIDLIYAGPSGCQHAAGTDQDHPELGAITVQLFPYDDTPNPGGEYKVWITPTGAYDPESDLFFGFSPSETKTDNFHVIVPPTLPRCGDGMVNAGEQCDDGNLLDNDGCSANCTTEEPQPRCGDGMVNAGEQCDDGNLLDDDGCSANCTTEVPQTRCGDGAVNAGEQCDDGNLLDNDGCSATCMLEKPPCCGDGKLDADEQCDDGNTNAGDGCSATCTHEVHYPHET